jgi:hypothetical protein
VGYAVSLLLQSFCTLQEWRSLQSSTSRMVSAGSLVRALQLNLALRRVTSWPTGCSTGLSALDVVALIATTGSFAALFYCCHLASIVVVTLLAAGSLQISPTC